MSKGKTAVYKDLHRQRYRVFVISPSLPALLLLSCVPLPVRSVVKHTCSASPASLPPLAERRQDRSMPKPQLNRNKVWLSGWEVASPPFSSVSQTRLPSVHLSFISLKRADTAWTLLSHSNREPCDVTQITEVAWGEQLETRTCTQAHTLSRRLRRWILS